jgi:putative phosphoesterase
VNNVKLGLISDIHADLTGLRRALAILKREAVDEMLCLGDLIDKGPEGDLVVMMLEALEIRCIQGNHDHDAPINQAWRRKRAAEGSDIAEARLISAVSLAYLKALPFEFRATWENVRVLAVHGSPADITEYLYEKSPQAKFKSLAQAAQADVILCGHTHIPMHLKASGVHFINPGSICTDYTPGSGTCATLTLPELDFRLFHVATGQRVRLEQSA